MKALGMCIAMLGTLLAGAGSQSDELPRVEAAAQAAGRWAKQTAEAPGRAAPRAWIGVRVTPVPAPLAAHLGRRGLMIANVAVGSPADRAGLEQYDVIVSLDGREITDLDSLSEAVASVPEGSEATITILRGGREQTMKLRPEARPKDQSLEFKYEEPAAESADVFERYFGHRLSRDPHGAWVFEPLGRLRDLPQDLKEELEDPDGPAWQQWLEEWKQLQSDLVPPDLFADPDDAKALWFFKLHDTGADVEELEFRIRARTDDGQIVVQRDADGRITVERTDAAGEKTTQTYDDAEALAKQDPQAHRLLRRHALVPGRPFSFALPSFPDLPGLQRDFQQRIEELTERFRKLDLGALEQSRREVERALEESRRTIERARQRMRTPGSGRPGDSHSESVSVIILNDRVCIEISTDGDRKRYEFESIEQLRKQEPELYERFRKLFEGEAEGARGPAQPGLTAPVV